MNSLAFGFFSLAIFGIGFLCLITLVFACVRRSWKIAVWAVIGSFGAVASVAGLLCLLVYFFCRPYDPTSETELKNAYCADFGVLPPPGITVLKARQVIVGDFGGQWLLLKATPDAIQNHISKGFVGSSNPYPDFKGQAGPNAPTWWTPPAEHLEYYENEDWTKDGGWITSRAMMGIDRSAGVIWFVASKTD